MSGYILVFLCGTRQVANLAIRQLHFNLTECIIYTWHYPLPLYKYKKSISKAHVSVHLNAQCVGGFFYIYFFKEEKVTIIKIKKNRRHTRCRASHSENWWDFRRLRNAEEKSASLTVWSRAFRARFLRQQECGFCVIFVLKWRCSDD